MSSPIHQLRGLRSHIFRQTEGLTNEQLNEVPAGCSNNIIWHLGHLIAAQQMLCYERSGLPVTLPDELYTPFLTGTRPEAVVSPDRILQIRYLALATLDQLAEDYAQRRFSSYSPSAGILQIYGFPVSNIDDALSYLLYHEGYHSGWIAGFAGKMKQ